MIGHVICNPLITKALDRTVLILYRDAVNKYLAETKPEPFEVLQRGMKKN